MVCNEGNKGSNLNYLKFYKTKSTTSSNEYTPLTWNQKDQQHQPSTYSAINIYDAGQRDTIEDDGLFRGKMMTTYASDNRQKSINRDKNSNKSTSTKNEIRLKSLHENQQIVVVQGEQIQPGSKTQENAFRKKT